MRTTLELDDEIVLLARQLAQQRGLTIGQVISGLARKGMQPATSARVRNGVPLLRAKKSPVLPALDLVNRLRDEP
ncbi:MAG: CopG family transcriptional regulator [Candidatus Solibacter usitatus]|nr:CopG family transcriptional regulator [Candidatus Solibacter usitatus]